MRKDGLRRRRFLKAVPAAVAGGLAVPVLAQQAEQPARRIGKETLECGEKIFGIDFTDAEEEQALNGVNNSLESYEQLRQIDVPLDTEPAVTFRPYLPGKQPSGRATRGAKLSIGKAARVQVSSSLEELAFEPVTALASLIESRRISSTDLTKMYLA